MSANNDTVPERAPIFVQVARLGGEVVKYALNGKRTVMAALESAGLYSEGDEVEKVRVNGEPSTLEVELQDGDVVTVAGRIEGAL